MSDRRRIGSQGIGEYQVAYGIGLGCKVGDEVLLLARLTRIWPDLPSRPEAARAMLRGLADRFQVSVPVPELDTIKKGDPS